MRHSLKIPIPCDPIISLSGLYHRAMVWYPSCKWQVPGEFKNHSCPGLLQIDWIYSYLTGRSPKQTNEPVHLLKETVRTEHKETWSLLVCNCETLEITWELPVWKQIHFIHTKQQLKREEGQNNKASTFWADSMHFKYCTRNVSFTLYNKPVICPILQMNKWRYREAK